MPVLSKCLSEMFSIFHHHTIAKEEHGFQWGTWSCGEREGDKALHIRDSLSPGAIKVYSVKTEWCGMKRGSLIWGDNLKAAVLCPCSSSWWKCCSLQAQTRRDVKYEKISCRRREGNCLPCALMFGLKVLGMNHIQLIWGTGIHLQVSSESGQDSFESCPVCAYFH